MLQPIEGAQEHRESERVSTKLIAEMSHYVTLLRVLVVRLPAPTLGLLCYAVPRLMSNQETFTTVGPLDGLDLRGIG